MGFDSAGCADAENGVSHRDAGVREMSSTSGAKMATMRVDAEPIPIQVWIATVGTGHIFHFVAEYGTHHVVDCVKLGNEDSLASQTLAKNSHCSKRTVHLLLTGRRESGMDVDSAIHWESCCVIDRRNCSPHRDPAAIFVDIQSKYFVGSNLRNMRRSTRLCWLAVFGSGISLVKQAPVAGSSISAFSYSDYLALGRRTVNRITE